MNPSEGPPRKVILATTMMGFTIRQRTFDQRVELLGKLLSEGQSAARARHGRGLDLLVLRECTMQRPGKSKADRALTVDELAAALGPVVAEVGCYVVVPTTLREHDAAGEFFSNAAVLLGRQGQVVGVYRKAHPAARVGSDSLEGGIRPGSEFPVFACDFGRVGIQICWDLEYEDGFAALAAAGAEVVAVPSNSPQTRRPAFYAMKHRYHVVISTPRDLAAIYDPAGMRIASLQTEGVEVAEVDLACAVVPWSPTLEGGEALRRLFGQRVGFRYYVVEDCGVFWSNDPATPIAAMLRAAAQAEFDDEVRRIARLQSAARTRP